MPLQPTSQILRLPNVVLIQNIAKQDVNYVGHCSKIRVCMATLPLQAGCATGLRYIPDSPECLSAILWGCKSKNVLDYCSFQVEKI